MSLQAQEGNEAERLDSVALMQRLEAVEETLHQQPSHARKKVEDLLRETRAQGFVYGEVTSLRLIGQVLELRANLRQAVEYYLEALLLSEKHQFPFQTAQCELHLSSCYRKLNRLTDAMNYAKQALVLFEAYQREYWVMEALYELGLLYVADGKLEKAILVYKRILGVAIEQKDTLHMAKAYNELGSIYRLNGQVSRALNQHRKAETFYAKRQDKEGLLQVALNKYEAFKALNKLDSAENELFQALAISHLHQFPEGKKATYEKFYKLYEAQGNYAKAFAHYKIYHELVDSLSYATQLKQLTELEAVFKLEQKEEAYQMLAEKSRLQAERMERERLLLAFLAVFCLGVFILAFFTYRASRKAKQANKLLALKRKEITTQNERLREINKEKDGIIGVVAHDLKSPLNKVEGFMQLMPLVGPLNEEQETYIKQVNKIVNGGKRLIRDLLDISDLEQSESKIEIVTFNIHKEIEDVLNSFSLPAKQKQITLQYVHQGPIAEAQTDPKFLERILDNLLSNAIKFSEKGTKVGILSHISDQKICIEVSDQGPGISPEDQKRMFKKFERLSAKPTAGEASTGLGLSIIKALVEKLGGAIQVKSVLGEGTTFKICLPQRQQ